MAVELALGIAAAGLALVLGALLAAVGPRTTSTRVLALLLIAEGFFQGSFTLSDHVRAPGSDLLEALGFVAVLGLCATYPWLLRELDSPLTRLFRRRRFIVPFSAFFALDAVAFAALVGFETARGRPLSDDSPILLLAIPAFLGLLVLSALAFFAAISAFRRAIPGAARERARAFAIAFGARDGFFIAAIALNMASPFFGGSEEAALVWSGGLAHVGTMVYVPLLAYGILKTQLFDIDLKIKLGISRGTVASIILVTVFVLAKVVENYLNRTAGFVAGSVVAGSLLFLVPKLNKVGEKVANTAMPQVQPTPVYVQFKKLEVYRAAVEAAQETGGIGDRERASLDRLRAKLGLDPGDCAAVEGEVAGTA